MIQTTTWKTYGAWSLFTTPTNIVSSFTTAYHVLFLHYMPLAVTFLLTVVLSLKNVAIQKQTLAVSLLFCAGEHHVQAQRADGLQLAAILFVGSDGLCGSKSSV